MGSLKVKNGEILKADGAWPICRDNFELKSTNLHHIKALNSVFHPLFDQSFICGLISFGNGNRRVSEDGAETGYGNSKQS